MTAHKPKVRAKFFVTTVKHNHSGDPNTVFATIELAPVYADGGENEDWSRYTPSGKIEMNVTNPAAIDKLELGKAYFVDFTPAD